MHVVEVWLEPVFSESQWCKKMTEGLRDGAKARHLHTEFLVLGQPHAGPFAGVILAGETLLWYDRMMNYCKVNHIRFCIASNTLFVGTEISYIRCDYRQIAENMVRYLYGVGKSKIAMFGVNPSSPSDIARQNGCRDGMQALGLDFSQRDIFTTAGDIAAVGQRFLTVCDRYDAVICANDLYAVYLLQLLQEAGIRIPQDVFLCGFGCTVLSRLTRPTLTSVNVNLYTIGYQAATCMDILVQDSNISTLTLSIQPEYQLGESTNYLPFPDFAVSGPINRESQTVYSGADECIHRISMLEACLAAADATDRQIINQLISNRLTKSETAERLFISEGTLNYRTEKLAKRLNCAGRSELITLLQQYARWMDFSRLSEK